ncbi:MAG: DNA-binding protein [Gordonia sp.]|nr:DNA-binding protein [Gordonia sp. (in: high G+C Gram-positive bacteria)]
MSDEPWGPSADGLDQPYWDGLREGKLLLQRCGACAQWIWGPQWLCGTCHTFDPLWEEVDPVGTVYSWSRSWYPFITELADRTPYITVLVELAGAGNRRVLGILLGDEMQNVRIGDAVSGEFVRDEGSTWPLLRWRRANVGAAV